MPQIIADLHIHSKYSLATSKEMELGVLNRWALAKGIDLLGTGDFIHPIRFKELKVQLESNGRGLFRLRNEPLSIHFMLTTEVSLIYPDQGKTRRVHVLLFAPCFDVVDHIVGLFSKWGKIASDGRPVFHFSLKQLIEMIFSISEDCMVIPAHIWTPWYSIFGDRSGYSSIEEAFGEYASHIRVLETGLSSDPAMNWRLSVLDTITLISNSDAHSPIHLGREANVFYCEMDYHVITEILKTKDQTRFLKTIEYFPEEGKYHYDGHRKCHVCFSPDETRNHHGICPRCGKALTVGVLHRISALADRPEGYMPDHAIPFVKLVPLHEIIAESMGIGVGTKGVKREYERITNQGGNEFRILMDSTEEEMASFIPERILEGILRIREGHVTICPGYDGLFGKVKIFRDQE